MRDERARQLADPWFRARVEPYHITKLYDPEYLQSYVDIRRRAKALGPEDVRELNMTGAIEWSLGNSRETMSPSEIWQSLQDLGRTDRLDSVSVTTSDLASRGRIEKVARGKYRAWPT